MLLLMMIYIICLLMIFSSLFGLIYKIFEECVGGGGDKRSLKVYVIK